MGVNTPFHGLRATHEALEAKKWCLGPPAHVRVYNFLSKRDRRKMLSAADKRDIVCSNYANKSGLAHTGQKLLSVRVPKTAKSRPFGPPPLASQP